MCDDILLVSVLIWATVALNDEIYQEVFLAEDADRLNNFYTATLINVIIGYIDVIFSPLFFLCLFRKAEVRNQLFRRSPRNWNLDEFMMAAEGVQEE